MSSFCAYAPNEIANRALIRNTDFLITLVLLMFHFLGNKNSNLFSQGHGNAFFLILKILKSKKCPYRTHNNRTISFVVCNYECCFRLFNPQISLFFLPPTSKLLHCILQKTLFSLTLQKTRRTTKQLSQVPKTRTPLYI